MNSLIFRSKLSIIIDTREQQPWAFPSHLAKVKRGMLAAGDYALEHDIGFAIERKSLNDLVGTIVRDWSRLQRELARMEDGLKIIIVEASFGDIISHNYDHPKVVPAFVIKRLTDLLYAGVQIFLADNPIQAAGMCYSLLKRRKQDLEN